MLMTTASQWRESFPEIPWDEPIEVTVVRSEDNEMVRVLACRICIADVGLKAQDILGGEAMSVFEDPDDFIEHLAVAHGD